MPRRVIPFGDRILVKRRTVGETIKPGSGIILPQKTQDTNIDIAKVVYVPELSFADKKLIENAADIITSLTRRACQGDSDALTALQEYNQFLKIKTLKVGDEVFLGKYVGVTFDDMYAGCSLSMVQDRDVIGIVTDVPE